MQMKYAPALRAKLQISEECERQLLLAIYMAMGMGIWLMWRCLLHGGHFLAF